MYTETLMKKIEFAYDHAYLGAYSDDYVGDVVKVWLDEPEGQAAWDFYKSDFPDLVTVAGEFEDEIQNWLLREWEAYLEENDK
jgi:hypothetical protein